MAKRKQHIDDFFKDRLKGAESPLDGSEWARLAREINPDERKKGILWWLPSKTGIKVLIGSALLFMAVIIGISLWETKDESTKPASNSTEIESKSDDNLDLEEGQNELPQRNNSDESPISDENESLNLEENDTQATSNSNVTGGGSSTSRNTTEEELKAEKADESSSGPENINPSREADQEINDESNKSLKEWIQRIDKIQLPTIAISGFEYGVENDAAELTSAIKPVVVSDSSKSTNSKKITSIQLVMDLKPGISTQLLNHDGSNPSYIDFRNKNENPAFGQAIDLGLKLNLANFYLSPGISFTNYTQSLNATTAYRINDTIPVIDINGDTIAWLPFNFRDTAISSNGLQSPSYRYVSVPLLIGKDFDLSRKWSLSINGGLEPKLLLSSQGTVNNVALRQSAINSENLRKFGLAARADFQLNYDLNNNLILRFSVGSKIDAINTSKLVGIDQKFGLTTMGVGMSFKLK